MKLTYQIKKTDVGKTIHQILKTELKLSTRLLNKLMKNQKILINGNKCHTRNMITVDDLIEIDFTMPEDNSNIVANEMKLDIVYEDDWFLVVNKPAGIPIHPSRFHYEDSLSNGIKFYFDSIGLAKKIRPVNRLDLDTSGLVIFAKCEYIQECLIQQMANHSFLKEYICFVERIVKTQNGNHRSTDC